MGAKKTSDGESQAQTKPAPARKKMTTSVYAESMETLLVITPQAIIRVQKPHCQGNSMGRAACLISK